MAREIEMERQPLGSGTVHIGGDAFVANGGRIEEGGPAEGSVGVHNEGSRAWGATYDRDPASPPVGSLQTEPLTPTIDYSANYSPERADRWKGDLGHEGHEGF